MKKLIQIFIVAAIFVSCASTKNVSNETSAAVNQASRNTSEKYAVPSDIFDTLQRPLGFKISPQLNPITRKNFEYYIAGIDLWDTYVMLGKKIGNGLFEKTPQTKGDYNLVEIQLTNNNYENKITDVFLVFSSHDRNILEKLRIDFFTKANNFFGKQGKTENDGGISWEFGFIQYDSYSIQKHEDGNWIYLIGSYYTPSI